MKRYFKYIKPYLYAFILAPVLMIAEVLGEVYMPKLMAMIINEGVTSGDSGYILKLGVLMVFVALGMAASGVGAAYFASKASISFGAGLRKDVFKKVQEFSFANIDNFSTGSLVTRLTNDITQLQNLIMMSLRLALRAPGMLIGAIIMAMSLNPSLTMVVAVVMPILILIIGFFIKVAFPRFGIMQKKIDRLNSTVQENLTNVRVVKSFVREGYEENKFAEANEDLKEAGLNAMKLMICMMPIMGLAMNLTTLAVVWFGGNQILVGDMLVGDLTAFTTYIVQILISLMMLSMVLLRVSRAMASGKRISEVLDTEVDLTDEHAAHKDAVVTKGKVEFRNVSFRYYKNNDNWVLDKLNFTANPGEVIGIIGSTGCGKTSMVQLIPRLYDADEGEVLVDDINVKDYSLKNLREGVGMVLQKNVLFSGSIKDNLLWGDENASMEEVIEVAKSAQADMFIQGFTDGYEMDLGQGGVNVSGGQKQRLCIARALLKKPKILILDDSTSAVDTATEARIRETFNGSLKDTTKIIIAQRITSVMDADQIVVLDEGKIVGTGNHEELMRTCETYQEIYYSQRDKEEIA